MVFWYKESDWQVPPMRPPDGGTDFNQVLKPDIDKDRPLTMRVIHLASSAAPRSQNSSSATPARGRKMINVRMGMPCMVMVSF